jgi:hypothetical protein
VVAQSPNHRAAERELAARRQRHQQCELRPLTAQQRDEYTQRWRSVQQQFVDQPIGAVKEADALVRDTMRARGYPVEQEFDQRAADISVEHPVVVENYRAATEISARATRAEADTEDLRQAMVHFRALFAELLGPESQDDQGERGADIPRETTRSI